MPEKKRVQDIVPSNKRTIRSVPTKRHVPVDEQEGDVQEPVPIRRAPPQISINRAQTRIVTPAPQPRRPAVEKFPEKPEKISPSGKRRLTGVLLTFGIIFIGIAIIAVALSLLYSKAAVTITPKTAHIDVNGTFTAKKEGDPTASAGSLVYIVATTTGTADQTVPATEGPLIETKAKGTVAFFNGQTTQQKIVAGTRIANSDGDIYRTSATIVIPAGATGTPGRIEATVVADQAGAQYNMSLSGPTEFKVVAYKGTPKYETVYAKLKTAITGGFSGKKTTIAPDVLKAAQQTLRDALTTKLLDQARKQVTKDQILYNNAYAIEFETPEPVSKGADSAQVTIKGTLTAAIFNRTALLKSIAAKELDKFPAPTYDISGLDDLKFTVVNSKDFSPRKGSSLIFTMKGPINLTGTFSETALKEELKGTYLKNSNGIFAHYPSIANAYALITPFWMRSFPNSADKIIIEIKK